MNNITNQLENFALPLPISQTARTTAQLFANQQPTPEKAEQVRLNTLAVSVVHDYLQMMEIPTDLTISDSWNPIIRLCANVADLEIPSIGRLECRPVTLDEQVCIMPPETWQERVGYVVVQINESLYEAKLLGFIPSVTTEILPLSQLQPPEALIDCLAQLKTSPIKTLVNLSQWFVDQCEAGWETLEALWNSLESRPAYAFRGAVINETTFPDPAATVTRRAKLINLGSQIVDQPVMLVVELQPEVDQKTSIRLQLHPTGNQIYLPTGVQLRVLDQSGAVFLEASARSTDNYIQLQFKGEIQEEFSVQVSFANMDTIEYFVI